jgi:hypothetical protein
MLRLIGILDAAEEVGLTPMPILSVHAIAYMADALAPVWNLPSLDSQVFKRSRQPFFPRLQADLDSLVGKGVVVAEGLGYESIGSDGSRLVADYELRRIWAEPILKEARRYESQNRDLEFVREVVYATAGLGVAGLSQIEFADAAYGDPLVGIGGVVDIDRNDGRPNATARAALRFGELGDDSQVLTEAEKIHLYVRMMYSRIQVA